MWYLRLELDKENLSILPLLNKDERFVDLYLKQIKQALEDLYPQTPKMKSMTRQEISILTQKKNLGLER